MSETSEYKTIILPRDGDRSLRGQMREIGEGRSGSGGSSGYSCDWTRGVTVTIYQRKAGGWAVWRHRWSSWQGESDYDEAWVADTAEDLYRSLVDADGTLRTAEKEAWEQAADHAKAIAANRYEEV